MTAKHMMRVCVSQNTRDVLKVSSCMNVFEKEKKDRVPFLRRSQEQRKGRKLLTLKWQQNLLRATKVRSTTKTNGWK